MGDPKMSAYVKLAAFGAAVLRESRIGLADLDGGWLQDTAVKLGVLDVVTVCVPCGEHCRCEEYGDWPQDCYRYSADVAAAMIDVTTPPEG